MSWIPPSRAHAHAQQRASSSVMINEQPWESVGEMRKRLGISFNYTPSLLHPETCRYLNEKECEEVDISMQLHAKSYREHQQRHDRRSLQSLVGDNINVGKIKVLVLLIQFTDHTDGDRQLIEKSVVEKLWNGDVKRWFDENSQGTYEIEPVVVDWVITDNTEEYYSFNAEGIRPELQRAMHPALDQLDAQANWDWKQFDSDNNGILDGVVMMHSGYDATQPDPDCKGREAKQRIRPHAFATTSDEGWTSKDGSIKLNAYAVASVYDGGFCDGIPFTPGLLCHEYMHTIGLPDLYDTNYKGEGVGRWDIMADPYGFDNTGIPQFLSVWSRYEVNWLEPEWITYDGFYVLKPAETSNHAYAIYLLDESPDSQEYLLFENRQQISFDEPVWDKGLMIYHIDEDMDGQTRAGFPGQEGWPENGNHYMVAVLQKDKEYALEQNMNSGDATDMWLPGDVLGPGGKDNTVFPNTDIYQSGWIEESGITIRVVSQQANNDIVFEVTGLAPAPADATNQNPPPPEDGSPETSNPGTKPPEVDPPNPGGTGGPPDGTGQNVTRPPVAVTSAAVTPSSPTSTPATPSPTTAATAAEPTTAQPPPGSTTTTQPPAVVASSETFHSATQIFESQGIGSTSGGFSSVVVTTTTTKWRTVAWIASSSALALALFPF